MAKSKRLPPDGQLVIPWLARRQANSLLLATLAQPTRVRHRHRARRDPQQIPTVFVSLPDDQLDSDPAQRFTAPAPATQPGTGSRAQPGTAMPAPRLQHRGALPNCAVSRTRRRLRRRWPGVSGGLCLDGPPAARRATPQDTQISTAHPPRWPR
jgi:hypothetical protein